MFAEDAAVDAFRDTPGEELLTGLRGKDVIFAVRRELRARRGRGPGDLASRSTPCSTPEPADCGQPASPPEARFLTSPTFGGLSWLAHCHASVRAVGRQPAAVRRSRSTATGSPSASAFKPRRLADGRRRPVEHPGLAGGRVVLSATTRSTTPGTSAIAVRSSAMPPCPTSTPCRPSNGWSLRKPTAPRSWRRSTSCRATRPWAPLPRMVDWNEVGDGSVFDGMPAQGESPDEVWRDADRVKAAYGQSIEYSLNTLISFVETYGDDDLVLVVLGDHQPATVVTGEDASRDVPITIIAHDPAVMDRISGWGWQSGMKPGPAGTGLADGRLPRPVPHRVRPVTLLGGRACRDHPPGANEDATSPRGRPGRHRRDARRAAPVPRSQPPRRR